jgi:hypothetical protein
VEGEARVTIEPGAHLGVLVGGVVVEDEMDELAGRDLRLDGVEEADELLVAVARSTTRSSIWSRTGSRSRTSPAGFDTSGPVASGRYSNNPSRPIAPSIPSARLQPMESSMNPSVHAKIAHPTQRFTSSEEARRAVSKDGPPVGTSGVVPVDCGRRTFGAM